MGPEPTAVTALRVLVVEDRPADALLMVEALRHHGLEPAWWRVDTEQDYLARLDPGVDVILADYNLPQFDPRRALTLLQERGLDIPLIIVSGTISEEVAVECLKWGAADYLSKDRLRRLGPAVTHALAEKALREEKRQAEAEIRRQREALFQREKLAAMGSLLAGIAHELNNPLSVVVGQAALLREAAGQGPLAERADKIARAADRCANIVRNFLRMARQQPAERRPVAVNDVVRDTMELIAHPFRMDGIEIAMNLAADLPPMWGDPHQLQQVVVNLATNARHALRAAPPPRRLVFSTSLDQTGQRAALEVADTGPGVPPALRERIFDPFFTTKGQGEGTGIGLSLCRAIVEEHGGMLGLVDRQGYGAVFRIELPVHGRPPLAFAAELGQT